MKRRCDILTITACSNMTPAVLEAGVGVELEENDPEGDNDGEDYQKQQEKRIGKTAVEVLGKVPRGTTKNGSIPVDQDQKSKLIYKILTVIH